MVETLKWKALHTQPAMGCASGMDDESNGKVSCTQPAMGCTSEDVWMNKNVPWK